MSHPRAHLWTALQRRFAEQNKPSISTDLLVRGIKVTPLDGQENSQAYSLGFREAGAVRRTVSLSRDFLSVAAMVDALNPCYLAVFVGDVHQVKLQGAGVTGRAQWLLVSFVPAACSAFAARKMADNRAMIKSGLGAELFVGDMWCSTADQITLSNYIRTAENGALQGVGASPAPLQPSLLGKRDAAAEAKQEHAAAAAIQNRFRKSRRGLDLPAAAEDADDAAEEVWVARIGGVRRAYVDSCKRLSSALVELEQSICSLTGDEYDDGRPLLHARAHMQKKLELMV